MKDFRGIAKMDGHRDEVRSIAFSPDNKTMASSGRDSSIRIWTIHDFKEIKKLEGHKGDVM